MNIAFERRHGFNIIVTAENVKIEEDVESREYFYTEDRKIDHSKNPKRDVKTDAIEMIARVERK